MGDGKTSGSGASSPFGDGGGKPSGGGMSGNDFVKNPAGSGGPSAGHNFVENGAQSPGGGAKPSVNPAKTDAGAQPSGTPRCPESIPSGGIWPQGQMDQSARSPQRDLGTGAQGAPVHKPFKVSKT